MAEFLRKKETVEPGDQILVGNLLVTIREIKSQEWYDDSGWIIEFIDSNNEYRYWKQFYDGGDIK